jgi:hypothetical protein
MERLSALAFSRIQSMDYWDCTNQKSVTRKERREQSLQFCHAQTSWELGGQCRTVPLHGVEQKKKKKNAKMVKKVDPIPSRGHQIQRGGDHRCPSSLPNDPRQCYYDHAWINGCSVGIFYVNRRYKKNRNDCTLIKGLTYFDSKLPAMICSTSPCMCFSKLKGGMFLERRLT